MRQTRLRREEWVVESRLALLMHLDAQLLLVFQLSGSSLFECGASRAVRPVHAPLAVHDTAPAQHVALLSPRLQIEHIALLAFGSSSKLLGVQRIRMQRSDGEGGLLLGLLVWRRVSLPLGCVIVAGECRSLLRVARGNAGAARSHTRRG